MYIIFSTFFFRKQYDIDNILAVFRDTFSKAVPQNFADLKIFAANYNLCLQDKSSKNCLMKIFDRILFGNKNNPPKFDKITFYKNTIHKKLVKKFNKENADFNNTSMESLIKYFEFNAQNYRTESHDIHLLASQKLMKILEEIKKQIPQASEFELTQHLKHICRLSGIFNKFKMQPVVPSNLPELIEQIDTIHKSIEAQLDYLNFEDEFKELEKEFQRELKENPGCKENIPDFPNIFLAVDACGELGLIYLSDFIEKINFYLSEFNKIPKIVKDDQETFNQVLQAVSLYYIKDYLKEGIITPAKFEDYLQKNAVTLRNNIKKLSI